MTDKASIVIIDDDRASLLLLEYLFRNAGLGAHVKTALGSEVGLRLLEEHCECPETCPTLVILDVEMPKFDGFAVLTWIFEKFTQRRPTTIMMSASQAAHHVLRASTLNADAYFVKFPSSEALKVIYDIARRIGEGDATAREELKAFPGALHPA